MVIQKGTMKHQYFRVLSHVLLLQLALSLSTTKDAAGCDTIATNDHKELIINTPGRIEIISTSGGSNKTEQEVQKLTLAAHQVLKLQTSGSISAGSFRIEFCDFSLKLPGFVQYAPVSSSRNEIIVITDEKDVQQAWTDFGVYKNYPIRISADSTIENQHRQVYHINLDSCLDPDATDNCIVVVPLNEPYVGKTITNGQGSVWGCDFSKKTSYIPIGSQPNVVRAKIEEILGTDTVYNVTKISAVDSGTIDYEITFRTGIADIFAKLDVSKLRGEGISGKVLEMSPGVKSGLSFDKNGQGWYGTLRLKFGDEITGEFPPDASASEVESVLRRLDGIGADVSVSKSEDNWSWFVTFVNEIGDVFDLEQYTFDYDQWGPYGSLVLNTEVTKGKSKVGGSFQLKYNGMAIELLADASEEEMRIELENGLGLKDVSVKRSGPTHSNTYSWTVEYVGDCPNNMMPQTVNGYEYYISDACDIALSIGEKTSNLLTGNDAEAKVRKPIFINLGTPLRAIWDESSRVPKTLGKAVRLSDGIFELFGKGRYIFNAYAKENSSVVVASRYVYVDTGPPQINTKDANISIVWPINIAKLDATDSTSFPGSKDVITSYLWSLLSIPQGSHESTNLDNIGIISNPNSASTFALGLDIQGQFTFGIQIKNNLQISSCAKVYVGVFFAPSIDFMDDVIAIPENNIALTCPASGSEPIFITWKLNGKIIQESSRSKVLEIVGLHERDEGNYSCFAENSVGSSSSNNFMLIVMDRPQVIEPPKSLYSVNVGENVVFSCKIKGHEWLNVTWEFRKNENKHWLSRYTESGLSSGKSSSLFINSVDEENEGMYRCVVENLVGVAASDIATLSLLQSPVHANLTVQPDKTWFDPGETIDFSCGTDAEGVTFIWEKNGVNIVGYTTSRYQILSANSLDAGVYTCIVTNSAGSITSNEITIQIYSAPVIVHDPVSATKNPGESYTFSVNATGKATLLYLWTHNGVYLSHPGSFSKDLTIRNIKSSNEGEYRAVVYNSLKYAKSETAYLSVVQPPRIDIHPVSLSLDPDEVASFFCNATGTLPLEIYWVKYNPEDSNVPIRVVRGTETVGTNFASLKIKYISNSDESRYACIVSNSAGKTMSDYAELKVNDPPTIVQHPNDTYVEPGDVVQFSVVATGAKPLTYKWRRNGVVLPNSNSPTLILTDADTKEGSYDVRVTNRLSPVIGALSNVALLVVAKAPKITKQPMYQVVADPGNTFSVLVEFTGAPPMYFAWERYKYDPDANGDKNIENHLVETVKRGQIDSNSEGTAALHFLNVSESEEGWYLFRVFNRIGNMTSSFAHIKVNDPPFISTTITKIIVDPDTEVEIHCVVEADPPVEWVTWVYQPIGNQGRSVIPGENGFTLTISEIGEEQEGIYVCLASNSAGSAEKVIAEVEVRDPPRIDRISPVNEGEHKSVDPGESINLIVYASGLEPMMYEWYRNGELLQNDRSNTLLIQMNNDTDTGKLYVVVRNALGYAVSDFFYLKLNNPAHILSVDINPISGRVAYGMPVSLTCKGDGTFPMYFSWQKDGIEIRNFNFNETNFEQIDSKEGNSSTLFIEHAVFSMHQGSYTCSVINSARPNGQLSKPIYLSIILPPKLQLDLPKDKYQYPGERNTFSCNIEGGTPPYVVSWYKENVDSIFTDGLYLQSGTNSKYHYDTNEVGSTSSLIIQNTSESDQGMYWCKICNDAGCALSRRATLGVHDSPIIIDQFPHLVDNIDSITSDPGEFVEISVTASGSEPLNFQWRKSIFPSNGSFFPVETDGTRTYYLPSNCKRANVPCKLVFDTVSPDDDGVYYCIVSNSLGSSSSVPVRLAVNTPPQIAHFQDWPVALDTACPGEQFSHKVGLSGTLPIRVSWFFSYDKVESPEYLIKLPPIQETSVDQFGYTYLEINNPTTINAGYYAFVAENSAGKYVSKISILRVNSGPSAAADALGPSPRHVISLPQTFTQLRGTASSNAAIFSWKLVSGPDKKGHNTNGTQGVILLQPTEVICDVIGMGKPGSYVFELTVVGPNGCSDSDTVTVIVNSPPVVVAYDQMVALPSQQIVLDASKSYDPDSDGSIIFFNWQIISGSENGNVYIQNATFPQTTLEGVSQPGEYLIKISVTDNDGAEAYKIVSVKVIFIEFPSQNFGALKAGDCGDHLVEWDMRLGQYERSLLQKQLHIMIKTSDVSGTNYQTIAKESPQYFSTELEGSYRHRWNLNGYLHHGSVQVLIDIGGEGNVVASSTKIFIESDFRLSVGNWSKCRSQHSRLSLFCGVGMRTREVKCYQEQSRGGSTGTCSKIQKEVDLSLCATNMNLPHAIEPCILNYQYENCSVSSGFSWFSGAWDFEISDENECEDFCFTKGEPYLRHRNVSCIDTKGEVVPDIFCETETKPNEFDEFCTGICRNMKDNFFVRYSNEFHDPCIGNRNPTKICVDGRTGLTIDPSQRVCSVINNDDSHGDGQSNCKHSFIVGGWKSSRNGDLATREVECISKTNTNFTQACSLDIMNKSGIKTWAQSLPTINSQLKYFYSISSWSNCSRNCQETPFQTRNAICMSSDGKEHPNYVCSTQNIERPVLERKCYCDSCGTENIRCGDHGECDDRLGLCVCDKGWTGLTCNVNTFDSCQKGTVSADNLCCSNGIVNMDGVCCNTNEVLDSFGSCCPKNENIDACGRCAGNALYKDVTGRCCSTLLDAAGLCCESGIIDECGVCDGTGLSCVSEFKFNLSVPDFEHGYGSSKLQLSKWIEAKIDSKSIVPFENINFLIGKAAAGTSIGTSLLLSRTLQSSDFESEASQLITLRVLHQNANKSVSQFRQQLVELLPHNKVSIQSIGFCGNGYCEFGERCLINSTSQNCCPSDCPFPKLRSCPYGCSGHGTCNLLLGQCVCFPGYDGTTCSTCSVGSKKASNEVCVPVEYIPKEAASLNFQQRAAGSENTNTPSLWPLALLPVAVLAGFVTKLLYDRYQKRDYTSLSYNLHPLSNHKVVVQKKDRVQTNELFSMFQDIPKNSMSGAILSGWLWKKSRKGMGGHQIWQQWYVVINGNMLWYLESDLPSRALTWVSNTETHSLTKMAKFMERGCIDILSEVVQVNVLKKSKVGYEFNIVLKEANELKESKEFKGEITFSNHRKERNIGFATRTIQDRQEWIVQLSKFVPINHLDKNAGIDRVNKSKSKHHEKTTLTDEVEISLPDKFDRIETKSIVSQVSDTTVDSHILTIGSVTGAIGKRVLTEGWVKTSTPDEAQTNRTSKVYAVLFADPHIDTFLRFYENFTVAEDGAHHFMNERKDLGIELTKISNVSYINQTKRIRMNVFVITKTNRECLKLKTQTANECLNWIQVLRDHIEHHFGLHLGDVGNISSKRRSEMSADEDSIPEDENLNEAKRYSSRESHSLTPGRTRTMSDVSIRMRKRRTSSLDMNIPNKNDHADDTDFAYADFQNALGLTVNSQMVDTVHNKQSMKSPIIKTPTIRQDRVGNEKENDYFSVV